MASKPFLQTAYNPNYLPCVLCVTDQNKVVSQMTYADLGQDKITGEMLYLVD